MGRIQIKRTADLKVATNESMWDGRNVAINGGSKAVLDRKYRIKPSMDKAGAQVRGFTGDEERHFLPQIIGVESNSPDFSKRCILYWQSIHQKFDSNGLLLDIGFEIKEENLEKWKKADEQDKYLYGEPTNLLHYLLYRYCLKWSAVANTFNTYKSKKGAKNMQFYFYTEEEAREAKTNENKFTISVMRAFGRVLESDDLTEGILRYFENGKTSKIEGENIGKKYSFDTMTASDKQDMLIHINKTVPAKFLELAEDPKLKSKTFIFRCISANVLQNPAGSTSFSMGDQHIAQSLDLAIDVINANGELRTEIINKLEAATKKA